MGQVIPFPHKKKPNLPALPQESPLFLDFFIHTFDFSFEPDFDQPERLMIIEAEKAPPEDDLA